MVPNGSAAVLCNKGNGAPSSLMPCVSSQQGSTLPMLAQIERHGDGWTSRTLRPAGCAG